MRYSIRCLRVGRLPFLVCAVAAALGRPLPSQTFTPTQAISGQVCQTFLGLTRSCVDITTDRVTRSYTLSKLNEPLFENVWGSATNCLRADPNQKNDCVYNLAVTSDPSWSRIIYGVADRYVKAFGSYGSAAGQFRSPRGVDLTNRYANGYGVFVADAENNRIAVLMINTSDEAMYWVGEITGVESGTRLSNPYAVAWDPAGSKPTNNDRLFILDTGNGRVLVYEINLDLFAPRGSLTTRYLGQFGTKGTGNRQFDMPTGIAVKSSRSGQGSTYYEVADVAVADAGNKRIAQWEYVLWDPYAPGRHVGAVSETFPVEGAMLTGVTLDHYGDVIATDQYRNLLLKYDSHFNLVKQYGNGGSWLSGSFSGPVTPEAVYSYGDPSGLYTEAGLAYVATTEFWGSSSGMQLHRLGIDLERMQPFNKDDANRTIAFSFILTAGGWYQASIRVASGALVRTFPWTPATSGVKAVYWDGNTDDGGRALGGVDYRLMVQYSSGYPYDNATPRTAYSDPFQFAGEISPLMVAMVGPWAVDPWVHNEWSVSVDGVTPYSYSWTRDGFYVGNGPTYWGSTGYCNGFDLAVTVTDGAGRSASDGHHVYSATEGSESCNPDNCPPDALDCQIEPQAAPITYEFAQSYDEESGGRSRIVMPSFSLHGVVGLSRASPPFAPTKANAMRPVRDRAATVQALRERGITHLRFGVPRASDAAVAAARSRTPSPNDGTQRARLRPNDAPARAPTSSPARATSSRGASGDNVPVTIRIYDMGGRLVRTAVRATLEPGYYEYEWDGRNDAGLAMPPGVYVAVMSAPSFAHRTKLILAR